MDEAEARLGTRLGNYALKEIIGRGGMAVVYLANHIYIGKRVAVKVLYRHFFDNPDAKKRFLHEAQAASLVDHPNVVGVSDFGESPDGTVFLVMSFVDGEAMEQLLRREGALPLFRALGIVGQAARAIGAAHEKKVIHRDLKPENIMLQRREGRRELIRTTVDSRGTLEVVESEGTFDFVTVLDFGAARIWDGLEAESAKGKGAERARDGVVLATPYYMAPETAQDGIADQRSDIYALGVILYRALTGSLPFEGETPREIMLKHVNWPPEPPRERNPHTEITPDAERVILKTLAKDPDERHRTMEELYADLQRCYGKLRFRRSNNLSPSQIDHTPRPVPLVRPKAGSGIPSPVPAPPVRAAQPTNPQAETGSMPLLLTKRKTDRHKTLPFGTDTGSRLTPTLTGAVESERHQTLPYAISPDEEAEMARQPKTPGPRKR